jgi:hypothetical protein
VLLCAFPPSHFTRALLGWAAVVILPGAVEGLAEVCGDDTFVALDGLRASFRRRACGTTSSACSTSVLLPTPGSPHTTIAPPRPPRMPHNRASTAESSTSRDRKRRRRDDQPRWTTLKPSVSMPIRSLCPAFSICTESAFRRAAVPVALCLRSGKAMPSAVSSNRRLPIPDQASHDQRFGEDSFSFFFFPEKPKRSPLAAARIGHS